MNSNLTLLFILAAAFGFTFAVVTAILLLKRLKNLSAFLPEDSPSENKSETEPDVPKLKGIRKRTNVLTVYPNGTVRTRNGGFICGYKFTPSETFYGTPAEADRLYNKLSLLITSGFPKDSVIQFRFGNQPDLGNMLNDQALNLAEAEGNCHPVAYMLKHEELQYYFDLAEDKNFRSGFFQVWIYIPQKTNGKKTSGLNNFARNLVRLNFKAAIGSILDNEKHIVSRRISDEKKSFEAASRHFRNFERNFPLPLEKFSFEEVSVRTRMNHNPDDSSIPIPPKNETTDWQGYLSRTDIVQKDNEQIIWHGRTPFTVITLFEPPESNDENPTVTPFLMRFLTTNPTLREKFTVVTEFIARVKDEEIEKIKKEIKDLRRANMTPDRGVVFKDDETKNIYKEKKQMLAELTSPGKSLAPMRFHIIVRGEEAKSSADRKKVVRDLEDSAANIIRLIHENMNGAQADLEDAVAIRTIYERLLIGEISPAPTHREIREQVSSLSCFIAAESDWQGVTKNPHNTFINTSGEIFGFNLLRNPYTAAILSAIFGASGAGKTVLGAELLTGFLTIPNARVRACDYGGSLAALVNLFDARYLRFSETEPRAINIWDYDELEAGEMPLQEQIETVVKHNLILLNADDNADTSKFAAILEKCVRQVYNEEVPRNLPGRRHEPTLSHLLRKLRSFPFRSEIEKQTADLMASRLDNYEGNDWVDKPTHPTYRFESRFDVYELSSLEKFPETLQKCLAFTIGSKIGSGSGEIGGVNPPTLIVLDEVHEIIKNAYLRYCMRGAEKTARHGRKQNKALLVITHSFDDIKDFPGFVSNLGTVFVGIQDDITSLKNFRKWNSTVEQTIYGIDNQKGLAHQFVVSTGQGDRQKITTIQVFLSSISLWTLTTDPPEDEARKILQKALPHWRWIEILLWLARNYPRGLTYEGKAKIDRDRFDALVLSEKRRNPQYAEFVLQMTRSGIDLYVMPPDINSDELIEAIAAKLDEEMDSYAMDNFAGISYSNSKTDLDVPVDELVRISNIPNLVEVQK